MDDIPAPKNCLYGELIYSTQPLAYVKSIKFKSSLASTKIIDVVTAKDIPCGGENIGSSFVFGDEPLFGDPIAEYAGQALGIVVGPTTRYYCVHSVILVVYITDNTQNCFTRLQKHRGMLTWQLSRLLLNMTQKI